MPVECRNNGLGKELRMLQGLRSRLKQEKGFTLIELLIVVIILAILAAIIIFAVGNFRKDSVVNACKTDVKSISTAQEAYKSKNGAYAANITALTETNATTGAPFLRDAPSNVDYTLTTATSGDVTVDKGTGKANIAGLPDTGTAACGLLK